MKFRILLFFLVLRYNIENLLSFLFENKINEKIKNN